MRSTPPQGRAPGLGERFRTGTGALGTSSPSPARPSIGRPAILPRSGSGAFVVLLLNARGRSRARPPRPPAVDAQSDPDDT